MGERLGRPLILERERTFALLNEIPKGSLKLCAGAISLSCNLLVKTYYKSGFAKVILGVNEFPQKVHQKVKALLTTPEAGCSFAMVR